MVLVSRKIYFYSIILWLICLYPCKSIAINYYWVGGTGSWSDINHWATTSGGTINHLQVPTAFDDVIFDTSSFSATNQTVTVNSANPVCRDMNWTGARFTPKFTGLNTLRVYGSLKLIPAMNWNYTGQIYFESTSPGRTITSAGKIFYSITFQGIGGEWTLMDALNITVSSNLISGSLITNNQNVNCQSFYCTSSNARSLILGSSIITVGSIYSTSSRLYLIGDNLSLDPGTSIFKVLGKNTSLNQPRNIVSILGSSALSLHNIEITNTNPYCVSNVDLTCEIQSKTTFHKMTISGKQFYLSYYSSTNAKIIIDSLLIMGDCSNTFDNSYKLKINEIICSQNAELFLNVDQQDTIKNLLFNGYQCTINGINAKFHKAILNRDSYINGSNTFDSLTFAPGYRYELSSASTQTINTKFSAEGACSGNSNYSPPVF